MDNDKLDAIILKITKNIHTDADISSLAQIPSEYENKSLIKLCKYNINIGNGKDIHIGDCKYYSWNDEALKALIKLIQFGDVDGGNLLLTKLNNARLKREEGDRQTGSFYTYHVWLEDVSLEKFHDTTENNRYIQQYTIQGKWNSEVYKEINAFGLRVDRPWGNRKKPYGNFNVQVELINGKLTYNKIGVNRYDDSANNYAADKAKQLIHSIISETIKFWRG